VSNSLHRVTNSWGEGTPTAIRGGGMGGPPTANSATWAFRFWNTSAWLQAGGDFVSTPSASLVVGAVGAYTWSSQQLAQDVQSWVQTPANNNGWLVRAEDLPGSTAKRFGSREFATVEQRPSLSITYE